MTPEEIEDLYKGHTQALEAWLKERYEYENRKEIMQTFIEQHQLPKDITIGELMRYCRGKNEQ